MTRPITIEQPAGSLLRTCVDRLASMTPRPEDMAHPNPVVRALTAMHMLDDEPRLWLLPMEFVRDVVTLPKLANEHGQEAIAALHPGVADELARTQQALAKAAATAQERRKPDNPRRNEGLVEAIIVGAWINMRRPWLSDSATYAATSETLGPGINAKVIRDMVSRYLRRMVRIGPAQAEASAIGVKALRDLLPDVVFKLPSRYSLERYEGKRKPAHSGERAA